MSTCPSCGAENPDGFRFCGSCGAALEEAAPTREIRKTVTVLFCDVTGSTALGERLDSESLRRVMERYFVLARGVLERHGGTVEKFIGDAVMAVFGIPVVHEDDALRAARAAQELREELAVLNAELQREFGTELQVRIGVNTGEVVTSDGGTLATGDAVNVAARLEQAAAPGDILIGDSTRQLAEGALELEPVPSLDAKGKSEPLVAYRLIGVRADAPAFERRFDAPFVGREGELEQLAQAYARAVRDRSCHLFTVFGPAGIGKSRIVHEFVASATDPIVLRGRCLAYGEGITYFPLVEILEQIAVDVDLGRLLRDDPRGRELLNTVSAAVGLADETVVAREDTFRAVRMLLEVLASVRPVILVFDDLHWAESTLLDLVDHVTDWSREAPILLLCIARPDLLDARPGWGGGKHNATTILLEPLSETEANALIDNLLAGGGLSESLRDRIAGAAEGNPLFVEQMLALIAQGEGSGNGDVAVPPTIQALLATRLEQLPSGERVAAERASVIGKEFWRTALAEIGGEAAELPGLVRKELIRPHRSPSFPADDAYRFRHQLIRDAAYDGMPKELRADLHERFGRWLEATRSEFDEIVGFHFEQSFRLKEQLGPIDNAARALAARAGNLLGRAGHRAYESGDLPTAVNLLSRASDLLDETDSFRLERLIELGYALHESGRLEQADSVFERAAATGAAAGVPAIESRGRIGRVYVAAVLGREFADRLGEVSAEIPKLEVLGDDSGLAEAWFVRATYESWLGQSKVASASTDRAIAHARRAGNRRLALLPIAGRVMLDAWGYLPADKGLAQCEALLAEHEGTWLEASIRSARAVHLGILGEREPSRREIARAIELFRQFGNALHAAAQSMVLAELELRAYQPVAAEAAAREAENNLEALGERGYRSTTTGILAEALLRQGRLEEAEDAARLTRERGADDDVEPQIRWRRILASIRAQEQTFAEAEELARQAVELAGRTDWEFVRGDALVTLAEVLESAGRREEARTVLGEALVSYEQKAARVEAEATVRRLAALG
jgi:class 3 adenylate cyclase/tetratricopeptide (TPR) repeat protein